MPIIGLSDQGASFPRIGELRKGAPKPESGNKPGRDLTWLRFTSKDRDALAAFHAAYGDEPQAINVFLPFNTTDENFESWVEEWGAGSLKWRGNGETLVIWQKPDGTYSREPKPQPPGGKEIGRLKVIIPELRRLAYVVALTTSIHDIVELSGNLRAYEALRGNLQGIPFVLSRVPRMVSIPMNGKRVRVEKWLLHLEAAPQWVQSQLSVMKRQALPGAGDLPALEAGDLIDVETGEILGDDDVLEGEVVEFDDLQSASDTAATNGSGDPHEAAKKMLKGGRTSTLAQIGEAAIKTGFYDNQPHAWNTIKLYDWPDSDKFELVSDQKVSNKTALEVLDWMIQRKLDEADDEAALQEMAHGAEEPA